MNKRTLINLLETSAEKFSDNVYAWEKTGEAYSGITYREIRERVHVFACGLLSLNLEKGDRVALISEGRADWVVAELGILYTGAINVPISVKIEELSELKFRVEHSGCKMIVVSARQYSKISQIKNELPELKNIIILDPVEKLSENEIPINELTEKGKKYLSNNKSKFENIYNSINEEDLSNICYTSGTTADPKGIMLTHVNYIVNVEQSSAVLPVPEWYCSLLILPWDHCFAHTAGIYTLMRNGASIASIQLGKTAIETLKNIPVNIKETRPTFLLSVPSLARNFRNNIEKNISQKGAIAKHLFSDALMVAYKYNGNGYDRGRGWRKILKPLLAFYDKILFSKIREAFGGRLEFFIGGGALLDIELQRFFYAIGIPMYQGYGLSESSPVISSNSPLKHKLGSSGWIVPNLEVKICDEKGNSLPLGQNGEIVVKGENVMKGYWKNEKSTSETIKDGWLYTGDLGYMDEDGFLYVLGREKSLLICNDGEKYSPEGIEETIIDNSEYIEQMMLYNNQSPYTVALVFPKKIAILNHLKSKHLSVNTEAGQKEALRVIEKDISVYRDGGSKSGLFPGKWLPAAIGILPEGFTEQNRFLNTTLKMVRGRIAETYKDRIDYLFTAGAKNVCNKKNMEIISGFGE